MVIQFKMRNNHTYDGEHTPSWCMYRVLGEGGLAIISNEMISMYNKYAYHIIIIVPSEHSVQLQSGGKKTVCGE